eukprot:391374-Amphidinium_carterae.4
MLRLRSEQSTPAAEARAIRMTQTQQYRRRLRNATPRTSENQQQQHQQFVTTDNKHYSVDLGA